jgi:hypothetical protein
MGGRERERESEYQIEAVPEPLGGGRGRAASSCHRPNLLIRSGSLLCIELVVPFPGGLFPLLSSKQGTQRRRHGCEGALLSPF